MSSLVQFEAAALFLRRRSLDRWNYKGLGVVINGGGGGVHQWRILWRRSLFGGVCGAGEHLNDLFES